jgi:hypothetical protein
MAIRHVVTIQVAPGKAAEFAAAVAGVVESVFDGRSERQCPGCITDKDGGVAVGMDEAVTAGGHAPEPVLQKSVGHIGQAGGLNGLG